MTPSGPLLGRAIEMMTAMTAGAQISETESEAVYAEVCRPYVDGVVGWEMLALGFVDLCQQLLVDYEDRTGEAIPDILQRIALKAAHEGG